jgi:hypothetical protein
MDEALKQEVADLKTTVDTLSKTVATAVAAMDSAVKSIPTVQTIAADTAARDKLADRLAAHVGTFDAKDKTLADVAVYGCEKLGLKPAAGHELTAVDAYLTAAEKVAPASTYRVDGAGLDAAHKPAADNFVSRHLAGASK